MSEEMDKNKKKKITLSIAVGTDEKINVLAEKNGMTKSGLIHFLVNQAYERGSLFK